MSALVLTIRPEPGAAATVEAARAAGLTVEAHPLFEMRALDWDPPPPEAFDALLLGSANAIRHGGEGLAAFGDKPVHAVGEVTAEAAREAGFAVASVGRGDLQALVDTLAPPLRLLRLAGAEHVPLAAPPGIEIETRVAYESVALPMSARLGERLQDGALVLLHSAAAARHFAAECDRLGVAQRSISLAALGPRIAAAAGEGWSNVGSVTAPNEAALLALARDMCQNPMRG